MEFESFLAHLAKNKIKAAAILVAFVILGVLYILLTPKSYRAEILLLPEAKGASGMSGLGQLASSIPGLGSLSMGESSADAIRPALYPSLTQSTPFVREFVSYTFFHPDFQDSVNLISYGQNYAPTNPFAILKKYTIGLPGEILSALRSKTTKDEKSSSTIFGEVKSKKMEEEFFRPTVGDFKYLEAVKDMVAVSTDKTTGIIKVSVQSTNPVLSAYLTEFTKNYIVNYMTNYRQNKQRQQVEFLTLRNEELERKFLEDQSKLASFKERNLDIRSPYLQNQVENLSAQYELSKTLYFSINGQLEQAKIKLNEETPIFAEIEPVSIPAIKSKPQTMLVLFLMGSLGVLSAALFVLIKMPKQK